MFWGQIYSVPFFMRFVALGKRSLPFNGRARWDRFIGHSPTDSNFNRRRDRVNPLTMALSRPAYDGARQNSYGHTLVLG